MNLQSIPQEILFIVLLNLADVDIQVLLRVNKTFRLMAKDKVLWWKILTKRNPMFLDKRLFRQNRPSRLELVQSNILAIGQPTLAEGSYLNGPFTVNCYRVELLMRKNRSKQMLSNHLENRPSLEELRYFMHVWNLHTNYLYPQLNDNSEKNLLPVQNPSVSPSLHQLVIHLNRLVRETRVKKLLNERDDVTTLDQRKLIPETAGLLASLLCPSVKGKISFYESVSVKS